MKIHFEELKKIQKGISFPLLANKIPRDAVKEFIGKEFLDDFNSVELGRGFGWLTHSSGRARFLFRGGVCERFEVKVPKKDSVFEQSIINDNVIFSKQKEVGKNGINNNSTK